MIVKTIIEFIADNDMDEMICHSAKKEGFVDCSSIDVSGHVDINNVTYCYFKNYGNSKAFLTIHILDNTVRIEAWNTQPAECNKRFLKSINRLLTQMGQEQII